MAVAAGGSVRLRDISGKSFRLYGRHFVAFSSLAALAISPFYLTFLAIFPAPPNWAIWPVLTTALLCPLLANGAITYGLVRDLQGRPAPMLETLGALARRFPSMIFVAISVTLLVLPDNLLTLIPLSRINTFVPIPSTVLGPSVILPPTAVIFCIFFLAVPVCVAEQAGIGTSLWRSRFLTKGHRWQIFGTIFLIRALYIAVNAEANVAALSMRGYTGRLIADYVMEIAVSWIVEAIFIAFLSVVAAVFYYELRVAKEGVGAAKIADVFE